MNFDVQSMKPLQPTTLTINRPDGRNLVTISMETGELTLGEDYDPDEAARIFWNAVRAMAGAHPIET